jgi:hypothetical protein
LAADDYDRLRDAVYVLESALEDVTIDLRGAPTKADFAAAIMHLRLAAREVISATPEPTAIGD